MNDLVWLLGQLTDVNGKILIDGISNLVAPVTDVEFEAYKNIDFDLVCFFYFIFLCLIFRKTIAKV